MSRTDLKDMSRAELIEIIYTLKKNEMKLTAELEECKEKLQKRQLIIQQSGSIAEAALALNGVFEAAQAAADEYLAQIKCSPVDAEIRCRRMIARTEAECQARREAADAEIKLKWDTFEKNVNDMLEASSELKTFLK